MAGHVNSMHDQAAQQLRDLIFGGDLTPGAFVDETRLCEQLAISRTPLREALKVLTAEGLIRHEPRRGCFVNQVTEQDLDEIFPVIVGAGCARVSTKGWPDRHGHGGHPDTGAGRPTGG